MSLLSTGFTSTIGVPSTASRLRTRTLPPSIDAISTRCSPIGLGRWGERVLNTPCCALDTSPRGCTRRTSRLARSSQVRTMTSSPTRMPSRASSTAGSNASHASGAPSSPCLGADAGSVKGDSTLPIGVTSKWGWFTLTPPVLDTRAVVGRAGVFDAIEPAQQLRARRVQVVVAVELQALHQGERGFDLARFGDGDGPVELHHRRAGEAGVGAPQGRQ